MTASEFYTLSNFAYGIVTICSLGLITDKLASKYRKIVSVFVILCVLLGIGFNKKGKDLEVTEGIQNEADSKQRFDSISIELLRTKSSLSQIRDEMNELITALKVKNLYWDSTNKTIQSITNDYSINVKSLNQKGGQTGFIIHN